MKKARMLLIIIFCLSTTLSWGMNKVGRLGIGMSQQLANDLPSISLKIQQSRYYALGGIFAFDGDSDRTLYGAGLRIFRLIFEEQLLNFYAAGTVASLSFEDTDKKARSGYQLDGALGTEFHFEGIESIGFSFEFGASMVKDQDGQTFKTLGNNFLKSAVHFYL